MVKQSHDRNQMKVRALDSTIRKLYEAASGLVNDGAETLRNYGLVHAVLDIRRRSIIRSSRLLRPNFDVQSRPGAGMLSMLDPRPQMHQRREGVEVREGRPVAFLHIPFLLLLLPYQNLPQNQVQQSIKFLGMTLMSSSIRHYLIPLPIDIIILLCSD